MCPAASIQARESHLVSERTHASADCTRILSRELRHEQLLTIPEFARCAVPRATEIQSQADQRSSSVCAKSIHMSVYCCDVDSLDVQLQMM